jgi:hypothetical protein
MIHRIMVERDPYPYADTAAAKMLASALRTLQREKKQSMRMVAKSLNYKQATVLSHMANGRIPVPIKKATEIAATVGLPQSEFLLAVMDQRQPEAHTLLMAALPEGFEISQSFADELAAIAGIPLDQLTGEQKEIMRKVVLDPRPARRWLTEAEIPVLQLLRTLREDLGQRGLGPVDRQLVTQALKR